MSSRLDVLNAKENLESHQKCDCWNVHPPLFTRCVSWTKVGGGSTQNEEPPGVLAYAANARSYLEESRVKRFGALRPQLREP